MNDVQVIYYVRFVLEPETKFELFVVSQKEFKLTTCRSGHKWTASFQLKVLADAWFAHDTDTLL